MMPAIFIIDFAAPEAPSVGEQRPEYASPLHTSFPVSIPITVCANRHVFGHLRHEVRVEEVVSEFAGIILLAFGNHPRNYSTC